MPSNAKDGEESAPTGRVAAAIALARGTSCTEAAEAAGVHESTISHWRAEPEFQADVNRIRRGLLDRAVGTAADNINDAMGTLRDLLTSDNDAIRARAAKEIINASIRLRESLDLEERVARLEGRRAT